MKKIILVFLSALMLTSCIEPLSDKTETRKYELTYIDGVVQEVEVHNVPVDSKESLRTYRGSYYLFIPGCGMIPAVIRYKRIR